MLLVEDAPASIKQYIENHSEGGFSLFQQGEQTYIYFNSEALTTNEYITTTINVQWKGGKYIATATIDNAVNNVNSEQLIKLDKITGENIALYVNVKTSN